MARAVPLQAHMFLPGPAPPAFFFWDRLRPSGFSVRAEPPCASPPGLSVRWSVARHVCSAGPPSSPWLLALKAEKLAGCERVFQVGRGGEEGCGRARGGRRGRRGGKTSHCNPMTLPTWGWGRWPPRALRVLAARPAGNNSLRIIRVFTRHENSCFGLPPPDPSPLPRPSSPPPPPLASETLSTKILARGTESFA